MDITIAGRTVAVLVIVLVAFAVLGVVQHLKGLFKKAPTWVWAVSAFALYFIFAAGYVFLPAVVVVFLTIGVLAWAVGQLGYELLWQTLIGWIRNALGLPAPAAPAEPTASAAPAKAGP
jgi:hypothetical protein